MKQNENSSLLSTSESEKKNYENIIDDENLVLFCGVKKYGKIPEKREKPTLISVVVFSFQCRCKICYSFSFCYILVTLQCVVVLDDGQNHAHPLFTSTPVRFN